MTCQKDFFRGRRLKRFEAIQSCLVPRAKQLSPEQKEESVHLVNHILSNKPRCIRKKLHLFLTFIDAYSVLKGGRTFKKLPPAKQTQIMNRLFDSKISLVRKGFWALNTLDKLGVYGQSSIYRSIGYLPKEIAHD